MEHALSAARRCLVRASLLLGAAPLAGAAQDPGTAAPLLRVGVTGPAYASWVLSLTEGVPVKVVPLLPTGADTHSFQPRPEDLELLLDVDVLVANGLGHDAFLDRMLEAAGRADLPRVPLHQGVPLIPYQRGTGHSHGDDEVARVNPHTFLSITTAIQQIYNLEADLEARLPEFAPEIRENARRYTRRLRQVKAEAARKLVNAAPARIATVHDGYSYLFQEFGLSVQTVIEPRHGVEPSAQELAAAVETLRRLDVDVIFAEQDAPSRSVELLARETGIPVYPLRHLRSGEFGAETFERVMQENLDTLVRALVTERDVP